MMKALDAEPDLVIEDADDVGDGFARVVTEVGGALCSESTALDALAVAVDVHEQPRVARFSADVSLRGPAAGAPSALDLPEASVFEALSADEGGAENLPHDDEADEHSISEEETQAFHQVTRPPQAPAPRASSTAVAGPRFSTTPRAVGHDERESQLRQAGSLVAAPPSRSPRTDEDLDLFTDDKPVTPRRR